MSWTLWLFLLPIRKGCNLEEDLALRPVSEARVVFSQLRVERLCFKKVEREVSVGWQGEVAASSIDVRTGMARFLSDKQYKRTSLSSELLEALSGSEECAVEFFIFFIKIDKLSPPDENHATTVLGILESGRGFSYWSPSL